MTLNNVCRLFDWAEVVDSQMQIDRDFYSITQNIYTDGEVKSHITGEALIHITSVYNATYIAFIDRNHKTCLCIYKLIPETKYKEIIDKFNILDNISQELKKCGNQINHINEHINNDVIDINTFTCTECKSEEKMVFTKSKTNPEVLETKCDKCKTEYTFVPSKYYKLASKRIIYFKSEESSRQIEITKQSKTT